MLETRQLSIWRGDRPTLNGVSLTLRKGEVTAICGPNGAGKSTLLSALAGLEDVNGGTVRLDGTELSRLTPQERAQQIGYLPQSGEVAWNVDVATLTQFGRLPWRTSPDEDAKAVAEALATLDLTRMATRAVNSLSGGERARALLARVLAGRPQWILADEPLAALDLSHQLALLNTFAQLTGREADSAALNRAGVVLVLHDLALAMNHADRVIVLDKGYVVADAPPLYALSEEIIAQVWGVNVRWLDDEGARALVPRI